MTIMLMMMMGDSLHAKTHPMIRVTTMIILHVVIFITIISGIVQDAVNGNFVVTFNAKQHVVRKDKKSYISFELYFIQIR